MELRTRVGSCAVWAAIALLGCASAPELPAAPPADAPAASRQVSSPPPTAAPDGIAVAELPADHPYADLRARLDQQRQSGEAEPDPLAPLREGTAARLRAEAEALRWGGGGGTRGSKAGSDAQTARLSEEIAAEAALRERSQREIAAQTKLDRDARKRTDAELRRAILARFEDVPLGKCAPGSDALDDLPGDLVGWRMLRRDDFLAEEASDFEMVTDIGPDSETGAHVSIAIVCHGGLELVEQGPDDYEASIAKLRYVALLDRERSWWNEHGEHISPEWTLRHEQVHFDLAEVEARRLNADRTRMMETLRGQGATPREAVDQLQGRWETHWAKVQAEFLAIEQRYDRETAHGSQRARQTEWFARAKRGLAESRPGPETRAAR